MSDGFNQVTFTLLEAVITLYPADASGAPVVASPLWSGSRAEGFTQRDRWIKVETRPTGARQPRQHPLVPQFQLSLERVWVVPLENLAGFHPEHSDYVLDVVWQDEDGGQWHRRTYYGVTISERDFSARDIESGFTDGQMFDARSFVTDSGTGAVTAISADLPYTVLWRGSDGQVVLYSYNAATHAFTAQAATATRATIAYAAGVWTVTFAGEDPVVVSAADGLHGVFMEQMPDAGQVPRLDFLHGATRVATITPAGLWGRSFDDTAVPTAGTGKFAIDHSAALVATLAAPAITALGFTEP